MAQPLTGTVPKPLARVRGFVFRKTFILGAHVRTRTIALFMAVSLSSSPAALAGYYLEHEAVVPHPQSGQNIRVTLRTWLQDAKLKRRSPLQDATIVVDLTKGTVTGVNDKQRTYWTMSAERYREFSASSLLIFGISPRPDGGVDVPPQLFEATGQEAEIAGRKSVEMRVRGKFPAGVQTDIWVSKDVPLSPKTWAEQLRLVLGAPSHLSYQNLFRQLTALPGYPVQTVTTVKTPQGSAISSETLVTVREETFPAAAFEVPADYKRILDPVTVAERNKMKPQKVAPMGIDAPL